MTVYAMCTPPRAGLGNKLIPWARSVIYAQQHSLQRISSPFAQFSLGPTLRREKDARIYAGQFDHDPEAISGLQATLYKARLKRLAEPSHLTVPPNTASGIVDFTSLEGNFATLSGHNALVQRALLRITRTPWRPSGALPAIGIHVRRGDFGTGNTVGSATFGGCVQTPLAWYRDVLRGIRQHVNPNLDAFVVSDGRDHELAELLNEPNVSRVDRGCAIADLWTLSQARVILGSGGSTFTGWGSFLGGAPLALVPGQSLEWLGFHNHRDAWRGNVDPANAPEFAAFCEVVTRAVDAAS
jgi:hypothetical protein